MGSDRYPDWCTAYTDASWHAGVGSWAVRLRHSKAPFTIERSGRCVVAQDAFAAEFIAIIMGIGVAQETWPDLKGVGVKTDCKGLLGVAKFGGAPHRRPDIRLLQEDLAAVAEGIKYRIRWVKGHQGPGTKQGWMNNRVDELAGKARRKN